MKQPIIWDDVKSDVLAYAADSSKTMYAMLMKTATTIRGDTVVSFYEEEDEEATVETNRAIWAMERWLDGTKGKYETLITLYEEQKSILMKDVVTTSRNWFNDSPSANNADESGEDLTHLSTFSKNVSANPYGTPMQRIAEIEESYSNVLLNWGNEFIKAFGLERNC